MVNLNPFKSTKYASILNCQTSAMAISTQPAFQKPSSLTRADIVAAAYNDLAASQSIQTIEHSTQSIDLAYIKHLKALMRYELGASLADYRDDDLVLLPHPHPVYLLAGELREGHGYEAEKVLRETQAGGRTVRTTGCEECRFQANYKVPERGNKAVVIKREDGEVVRTVNQPIAARKSGVQPVSALSLWCSPRANIGQASNVLQQVVNSPSPEGPQPQPIRRGFDPEATTFTPKPQTEAQTPAPVDSVPVSEGSKPIRAFYPPPFSHVSRLDTQTEQPKKPEPDTRSPSAVAPGTVSRDNSPKPSVSSHTSDDVGEWLNVGFSDFACELCRYLPPDGRQSQVEDEEAGVHLQIRMSVRSCAVHEICRGNESRLRCGGCLRAEREAKAEG